VAVLADRSRPDLERVFPGTGTGHGFSWSAMAAPGAHQVCMYAIDAEFPFRNIFLGCRNVTVPAGTPADAIRAAWVGSGSETGPLGAPTGDAQGGLVREGYYRPFQNGAVYWSPATGARIVLSGPMRDYWVATAAEQGMFGYPTTDTVCGLADGGCGQHFEVGDMYFHDLGVRTVDGVFLEAWAEYGREEGPLDYPVGDATRYWDGHIEQDFQYGLMLWWEETGVTVRF
jgi:uncharacterized protein with LGFP repeats